MPEITSYAPGTPSWVDFSAPDIDASVEFYGGLFGWEVPESENAEQTGGYRQAMKSRPACRRDDAADAGGPAVRPGRPTSRSRTRRRPPPPSASAGGTRDRRADGGHGPRHDGGLRRPRRRRLRDLAARDLRRRRASSTSPARSPGTSSTPATWPAPRSSTAPSSAGTSRPRRWARWDTYTTIQLGGNPVGGILDMAEREVPERSPPIGRSTSGSRTPTPRSSRPREPGAASWSSRSTSPPVASRSSPTRTAPASR